jgi:RNA polymerase sigma-70 factor, ECF subfamily
MSVDVASCNRVASTLVVNAEERDSGGPSLAERALIEAAREGDHAAWELLYLRLYPRLHAYLTRRVGAPHAEDAVSETMARAVSGFDGFILGRAGFDGWVFGIARRVAADHYRKKAQRRRQGIAAARVARGPDHSGDPTTDGLCLDDDRAQIRRLFDALSPAEREILELRVVAGLSSEQVGMVLDKAPGAVRTAQSRALGRLRRLLEADDA